MNSKIAIFSLSFFFVLFFDLFVIAFSYTHETELPSISNKIENLQFSHVSSFAYRKKCWNVFSCKEQDALYHMYSKLSNKWFSERRELWVIQVLVVLVFSVIKSIYSYIREESQSVKDAIAYLTIPIFFLFSYIYFGNRIDSYQHRYLVCIILFYLMMIWNFYDNYRMRSFWSQCLQLNIAIVYFWTLVVKLDYAFLSGEVFKYHMNRFSITHEFYRDLVFIPTYIFSSAAVAVVIMEFLLCCLWIVCVFKNNNKYLKIVTIILALLLHIPIGILPYKIGLFSFYMISIYIFKIADICVEEKIENKKD